MSKKQKQEAIELNEYRKSVYTSGNSIELMGKNSKINLHLMPIAFRRNNTETRKTKTKKKQEKLKVPMQNWNKCENLLVPRYSSVISFYIIGKQTTISVSIF